MLFVSPATRLLALLMNAMHVASGVITGSVEGPFPKPPSTATLISRVVPVTTSRRKISVPSQKKFLLVSPATRSLASLWKTTYRPLAETWPRTELLLPPPLPLRFGLARMVVLAVRSRKYTFRTAWELPPGSRSFAELENTTNRPSGETVGPVEIPLPEAGNGMDGSRTEIDWLMPAFAKATPVRQANKIKDDAITASNSIIVKAIVFCVFMVSNLRASGSTFPWAS